MTAVRSKPSGYGIHDIFTATEAEIIDSQLPYLLDARGGTYALATADLTINGPQAIVFGANLTMNESELHISGTGSTLIVANCFSTDFTAGNTLFDGTAEFTDQVDISFSGVVFGAGAVGIDGPDITMINGVFISETSNSMWVKGGFQIDGTVTITGSSDWTHSGTMVFVQSVTLTAGASVGTAGLLTFTGGGHIVHRYVAAVNADHSYAITDGDYFVIPTLTATRTYTVNSTAEAGSIMIFSMDHEDTVANSNGIVLERSSDNSQIGQSIVKNGASWTWMAIIHDGSDWQSFMHGIYS